MGAEVIRTELRASGDRRVRAGLRGAVEHLAGRHGMSAAEQREFANDVDRECGKTIEREGLGALCDVIIEEREARIEARVRHAIPDSKNAKLRSVSSAKDDEARGSDDGRAVATFIRRFHKSPTHS